MDMENKVELRKGSREREVGNQNVRREIEKERENQKVRREWTLRDTDNEQALDESEFREGRTEVGEKGEQMMIITRAKGVQ